MIKITILIPVTYNNKTPVPLSKIAEYFASTIKLAGGLTSSRSYGSFLMDDGKLQQDDLYEVWIIGEYELLDPMRAIAKWIAVDLRQKSVYLEWHDVNVEFTEPPEE